MSRSATNPWRPHVDIRRGPGRGGWCAYVKGTGDLRRAEIVVCGWGRLGGSRGPEALRLIRECGKVPHALRLNGDGTPAHPLYLPKGLQPIPMEARHG